MKTTLEIPDSVFRRAKADAASRGIPFRQFVTDAVEEKLRNEQASAKPWMKFAGKLAHLQSESARINQVIDEEFGRLEPEDRL